MLALSLLGVMLVGGQCGQTAVHRAVGMTACPVTLVHHVATFLAAFTAVVVAIAVFAAVIVVRSRVPQIRPVLYADPRLRSTRRIVPYSLTQELFRRGILHRREDPAAFL